MITDEEYRKIISKLKLGTPETRIIVDKWNYRIFKRYKVELFEYFEDKLKKEIEESTKKDLYNLIPSYPPPHLVVIPPPDPNVVLVIKENEDA